MLSNSKFTITNAKYILKKFRFSNSNQRNQMLTKANAKSERSETSEIFHFCDILHHSSNIWKYASFEGVEIAETP